jgi:hypothetical protein
MLAECAYPANHRNLSATLFGYGFVWIAARTVRPNELPVCPAITRRDQTRCPTTNEKIFSVFQRAVLTTTNIVCLLNL